MADLNQIPIHLHPLAKLFPQYSRDELNEAYENLRRYAELGWKIATRLEREGKLEAILTDAGFNPTVKPPTDHSSQNL